MENQGNKDGTVPPGILKNVPCPPCGTTPKIPDTRHRRGKGQAPEKKSKSNIPNDLKKALASQHLQVCKDYERNKFCVKGSSCQFIHDYSQFDSLKDTPLVFDAILGVLHRINEKQHYLEQLIMQAPSFQKNTIDRQALLAAAKAETKLREKTLVYQSSSRSSTAGGSSTRTSRTASFRGSNRKQQQRYPHSSSQHGRTVQWTDEHNVEYTSDPGAFLHEKTQHQLTIGGANDQIDSSNLAPPHPSAFPGSAVQQPAVPGIFASPHGFQSNLFPQQYPPSFSFAEHAITNPQFQASQFYPSFQATQYHPLGPPQQGPPTGE